jgi:hypothetical protein
VKITNIGTDPTGELTVTWTDGDPSAFVYPGTIPSIAVNGDANLIISPASNLTPNPNGTPKTYTATLTVGSSSFSNLKPKTYRLSFTVHPDEIIDIQPVIQPVAAIDGGIAEYAPTFPDASAITAYLKFTYPNVTAIGSEDAGSASIPVSDWADADGYDPDKPGSYTFTATLGAIPPPVNYVNPHNLTTSVEVTLAAPVDAMAPLIRRSPASYEGFVGERQPYRLTVTAESLDGGRLSYQWYTNTVNDYLLGSPSLITGANSTLEDYSIALDSVGATYYWCEVTSTNTDPRITGNKAVTVKSHIAEVAVRYAVLTVEGGEGGGEYTVGDRVPIAADPPPDEQIFYQWIQKSGPPITLPDAATGTVAMPAGDVFIAAEYAPDALYRLTVVNGAGGGSYPAGAQVGIRANSAPAGQVFDRWELTAGSGTALPAGSAGTVTMPAGDLTVTARYRTADPGTPDYLLTVVNGSGGGRYPAGTQATVTANPAPEGQVFDRWELTAGSGVALPETAVGAIVMPAEDVTLTALYKSGTSEPPEDGDRYTLTVVNGTGSGLYSAGAQAVIAANPAPEGQSFDRWELTAGSGVTLPETAVGAVVMPAEDITVTALYKSGNPEPPEGGDEYTLTVVNGSGGGRYPAGTQAAIAADPAPEGQSFDRWELTAGSGVALPETAVGAVVMPAEDVTVTALYTSGNPEPPEDGDRYTLTVVNGAGSGRYPAGAQVSVTANPAPEGQTFDRWELTAGARAALPEAAAGTVIMPAGDLTIAALYKTAVFPPGGGGGGGGVNNASGGGSSGGSGLAPTADGGQISLDYSRSGGTVVIRLPEIKVREIAGKAADGAAEINIRMMTGATDVTFTPKEGLRDLTAGGLSVTVDFPLGAVTLDSAAIRSLVAQAAGSDITIAVRPAAASPLASNLAAALPGGAVGYDVSVYSGGRLIHSYTGKISVAVPYDGRLPVAAWYVGGEGAGSADIEKIDSFYSTLAKTVTFTPPHLSLYAVGYAGGGWPFVDVREDEWFYSAVEYAAARGLMEGVSETVFEPNAPATRGMFVSILGKIAGADIVTYAENPFADVKSGEYYEPYIRWARKKDIVSGVGDGRFDPESGVTREQMAAILVNYVRHMNITLGSGAGAVFADEADISPWARDAVSLLAEAGVVKGVGDGRFAPDQYATRAEIAAILSRITRGV